MKKLISLLLTVITIVTTLSFAVPAQAADTISSGQSVDVVFRWDNSYTSDKVTKEFKYTMPASGYFYYKITPKYCREWHYGENELDYTEYYETDFYLPGTSLTQNYKRYIDNRTVFYGENYQSPKLAFKKGSTISITLTEDFTYNKNFESCYMLSVYFVKVKNFETENNNSKKTASKLALKKTYTGNLVKDDVDYWVFKAPKTGKYKVSAVSTEEIGGYYYFRAYKGSKDYGGYYMRTGEGYNTVFKGKLKKGQKLYIKVHDGDNGYMYKLKVKKY